MARIELGFLRQRIRSGPNWYVTGERLQALADVTFTTREVHTFHRSVSLHVPRSRQFFLDRQDWSLSALKTSSAIFVYTHLLDNFIAEAWPRLVEITNEPFTLITHNSDHGVDQERLGLLESDALKVWFAQNPLVNHPKLRPIPIGLANSQWEIGNIRLLHRVRSKAKRFSDREGLLFASFRTSTLPEERTAARESLSSAGLPIQDGSLPFRDYLLKLATHKFVACPRGNGLDTHRVWETLYLGGVPVGNTAIADRLGLPNINLKGDWDGIVDALNFSNVTHEPDTRNLPEPLSMRYWARTIRGHRGSG